MTFRFCHPGWSSLGLGQFREISGALTFVETPDRLNGHIQMWNPLDLVLLDWFR
jgi:hypothetical protein